MPIRNLIIVVVVVVAFLGGIAWQSQMQKQPATPAAGPEAAAPAMPGNAMPPAGEQPGGAMGGAQVAPPPAEANPGLAWSVPAGWKTLEPRAMRLATYGVPAAGGGEGCECAVFYFGPNQGGGVAENLDRWVGQFEHPSQPERSQSEVGGLKVWRVHVKGAYLAPSGPMMQSSGTKAGYALNGAIVEGPGGRVFFKLTGPEKAIEASKPAFEAMLKSLHKS